MTVFPARVPSFFLTQKFKIMSTVALPIKEPVFVTGLVFIAVSLLLFMLPTIAPKAFTETFGVFGINYLAAFIFFFIGLLSGKLRRGSNRIHIFFVFLILCLISAYSLNREMSVFQNSTTWMCVLLVTCCANYILLAFSRYLPAFIKHFMCFVLGIATVLFLYLSIYLVPLYGISAIGFFLLGISLHTFVPLAFTVGSFFLLKKILKNFPTAWVGFSLGVISIVSLAGVFVWKWNNVVTVINSEYKKQLTNSDDTGLPAWVRVSQKLQPDAVTEKVLKSGLNYALPAEELSFTSLPRRNFDQEQKHDPLVMVSALTTHQLNLPGEDRVNILRSLYDSRHQAEERLWSGKNLVTDHVATKMKLWPSLRIAYTEKIITVTNKNTNGWGMSEEGIYTFYLPEGGVVTSLSLWINGKEEKAILTTKEKAATAYNTIVGVEVRDPSVIHWQEGNRVSVRVFPVLRGESRIFKVGITSPVAVEGGDLVYSNIWFDGPSVADAEESIEAEIVEAKNVVVPSSFQQDGSLYKYEGNYEAEWSLSCPSAAVANDAFSFDGHVYAVQEYKPDTQVKDFNAIYLDVNSSWTVEEFNAVWSLVKDKNVFLLTTGNSLKLDEDNQEEIFAKAMQHRFSLFPFYKIQDPTTALVITKSERLSPNLDELKGSQFLHDLETSFDPSSRYNVFNISSTVSPYLASLRERRYFHYEQGSLAKLQQNFTTKTFAVNHESDEEVIIHNAAIKLVKKEGSLEQSTAPDHLLRLFAYNYIMRILGIHPDAAKELADSLVEVARQAYIVSPLSSLVVLETRQDYERFNIQDHGNSLKNASMKSTGAVPEPHEWALIILAFLILFFTRYPHLLKRFVWKA